MFSQKPLIFVIALLYSVISIHGLCLEFDDITEQAKVLGADVGNGVAFVDYNGDGFMDIYVSADPHDVLYRNKGDGTFEDVTGAVGISFVGDGVAVAFGDYDNDGDPDLYIAVNDGWDVFFQNEGGGNFRNITRDVRIDNLDRARSAAFADFDRDGFLDIYVVNENSANKLYKNIDGKFFKDVALVAGVAHQGPGRCGVWGDYDNDGDPDLYVTNKGELNVLYHNDGGIFKDVTKEAGVEGAEYSTGAAFADYDNDGDLDLYVGGTKQSFLYRNNGDSTFINVADIAGVIHFGEVSTPAFGDYDNDGYLDLYLSIWNGRAIMYRNNGDGTFSDVTEESGMGAFGNSWSAVSGDYDGDGDLDIYTTYTTRTNILYRNKGNNNNWLHVKTQGLLSNRDGIGARVKIVAGGVSQMREVSGGSAYGSQDSLPVEFGLGDNETVEVLEVIWQSGITTRLTNVKANRLIVAVESFWAVESEAEKNEDRGNDGINPNPYAISESRLLPNYPNPFNPETWIPYQLAEQSDVEIEIYNSIGRLIRRLEIGNKTPGRYLSRTEAVHWDGKDDNGEQVASGVYFCRLKAHNLIQIRKMVLKK